MRIKIKVTQEFIDEAVVLNEKGGSALKCCPIALAFQDRFGGQGYFNGLDGYTDQSASYRGSRGAVRFAHRFDLSFVRDSKGKKEVVPSKLPSSATFIFEKVGN